MTSDQGRRGVLIRRSRSGGMFSAALVAGGMSLAAVVGTAGVAGGSSRLVISTAKNATFGTILVSGNALYSLTPSKTACTAACFSIWPPVMLPKGVTKATAGPGVSQSKLGTVRLPGGGLQVTYAHKALYRYSGDSGPGQVNGNFTDTWGKWSVVITSKATHAGTGSNPGGGTGGATSGSGGAAF